MTQSNSPQSAALALAQLLTEYSDLPLLHWTVSPSGWWSGSKYGGFDARAAMAAFVAVVGGTPYEMWRPAKEDEPGEESFTTILNARWRDVDLYLSMGCDAALVAEDAQVTL
ncbi:hypothetical protein [Streptomyces acidiscabies]|uniref:hypothetical protein n=1 Tax=Streptomyces acidiscabies TaxID=42234 RepID=UPI0009530BFA|nr:hypothetical protein [Streptomyces acidiscabies]